MDKQLEERINEQIELSSFGNFIVRKVLDIKNWPMSREFYNKLNESLQKERIELNKRSEQNLRYKFKRLFRELEPQLTDFKNKNLDYSIDILSIILKEKIVKYSNSLFSGYLGEFYPKQTPIPEGYHVLGSTKNPRYENEIAQFYEESGAKLGIPKPDPEKYGNGWYLSPGRSLPLKWEMALEEWRRQIVEAQLGLIRPSDRVLVCIKLLPKENKKKITLKYEQKRIKTLNFL